MSSYKVRGIIQLSVCSISVMIMCKLNNATTWLLCLLLSVVPCLLSEDKRRMTVA